MTTGPVSDDMLMAYADGELSEAEAAAVKRAVSNDPHLATKLSEFEATRQLARDAFASIKMRPVPPELVQAVLSHASQPKAQQWRFRRHLVPLAASIAVVAGVVGYLAGISRDRQPSLLAVDRVMTEALETADSGATIETDQGRRISVLATYRLSDRLCRTFAISAENDAVKGLACRTPSQWSVEVAVSAPAQTSTSYSPASNQATPSIDAFLDSTEAEGPLDGKLEAEYRKKKWLLAR